jgi:hypothetical protein
MSSPESVYEKCRQRTQLSAGYSHMTCFNVRYGHYGFLKSGFSAEQILDRLGIQVPGQVFGPPDVQNLLEFGYKFCRCSSAFRRLLEHTFFITVATVTAV